MLSNYWCYVGNYNPYSFKTLITSVSFGKSAR